MRSGAQLELRVLGSLEVVIGDEPRPLRGPKQARLLAFLVLHLGEVVGSDRLIDGLWGDDPPPGAVNTLHVHVSQLRKLLGRDALVTRPTGYVLELDPEAIDAVRFERLAAEGSAAREAGEPERAAALLREALGLWRGPPLEDVRYEAFAQAEIARLEELAQAATEERIAADLELGRHADVLGELEALVTEHPLREGVRGQLMVALYRSGRQADALEVYREGRRLLADELGLEPGPALQELERAILRQDPSLEVAPRPPAAPGGAAPTRELRKTVTVLAVELRLAGPALDPEARQAIVTEALAAVTDVVAENEGTVHELAGERITAVFGAPVSREDDAVRAVRAAAALGDALAPLNARLEARSVSVSAHAGIDTGTVLAGASVAGEVVAVAARLGHGTEPGEILVGPATQRLVRHAVDFEPAGEAFRVAGVAEDAPATTRRLDAPLVGRLQELEELGRAFRRTADERRPTLVTVLGPAGIGKSRLVAELVELVEPEATVLAGRCPSYGDAGGLGPVAQVIRQAAGAATAEAVLRLLGDHPDAGTIAERLAAAAGLDQTASVSSEEFSWAVRKLFQSLARERPLVLVFEDIHWARGRLLDLIESVVDLSRGSPILVVCLARPELLDERPAWGGGKLDSISTLLGPLSGRESEALVENLGGSALAPGTRARVIATAEGNPLFLEQLLAVLAEDGVPAEERDLPPTVEALIAARLDRLDPDERAVLERGAIVGREFRRDAAWALLDDADGPALDRRLERLVRRELILPAPDAAGADDVYRFHHMLVRETAYKAMPKALRADLHERFADWLAADEGPPGDLDEARGYHLEQAHLLLVEIGGPGERSRRLGEDAAAHLSVAGRRAYARDDGPAAARLLSRAAALMPADAPERLDLLVELGEALRETGDFDAARLILAEAMERAAAAGDRATGARAQVVDLRIRMQTESEFASSDVLSEVQEAIAVLEEAGDERGLARAWTVRAWVPWLGCRAAEAEAALRPALELARRTGDTRTESYGVNLVLGVALFGPTPVAEAVELCEEVLARASERRRFAASAYRALAGLRAMEGRFDEARELLERDSVIIEDLGLRVAGAVAAEIGGMVELLAGDPRAAEERLRAGYDLLVDMGERSGLSNLAPMLARALHEQGLDDEALAHAETGQELAPGDDLSAQVQWRGARAVVLAARGDAAEAETLARTAAELASRTDFLNLHGDALADLAEVRRLAGRPAEAAAAGEQAIALYERKGNVVAAERTRAALAGLPAS